MRGLIEAGGAVQSRAMRNRGIRVLDLGWRGRRGSRATAVAIGVAAILAGACFARVADVGAADAPHSIVLPPTLVAEAPATLAVLDAAGRLVPGVGVTLSDGRVIQTDATGRARLVIPAQIPELQVRIAGSSIVATSPVVARAAASEIQVTDSPTIVDVADQFAISGARFQGDADANHVWIGGKAALVLASSPASLVVLPAADTPLGASQLRIEGSGSAPQPVAVTVVALDAINPPGPLRIGQAATLTVRVHGTTQALDLELGNWDPNVIKMLGPAAGSASGAGSSDPNTLRVKTSGGPRNQAEIQIVPLTQGKFYVRARLAHARE